MGGGGGGGVSTGKLEQETHFTHKASKESSNIVSFSIILNGSSFVFDVTYNLHLILKFNSARSLI